MKILGIHADVCHQGHVREIDLKPSPVLGYVVGTSFGDGNFSHKIVGRRKQHRYLVRLEVKAKDFLFCQSFGNALSALGLHPYYYEKRNTPKHGGLMIGVRTSSKLLVNYLKGLTEEKIRGLVFSSRETMLQFLRGFYESDGCFWKRLVKWKTSQGIHQKREPVFSIKNTSLMLIRVCRDVIRKLLGFKYSIKEGKTPKGKPTYELNIKGSRALKLLRVLNPSIKRGEKR